MMSDYYTQCSLEIQGDTAEAREWLRGAFAEMERAASDESLEEDTLAASIFDGEEVYWDWELGIVGDACYISCETSGDIESLSKVLEEYLRRFSPEKNIGLTWSETCSKSLAGAFSGGACLITASGSEFMTAAGWLYDKQTNS